LHRALKDYYYTSGRDIVELLVSQGADINAQDNYGQTPLHYAADKQIVDMVELLVSQGVDINAQDNYGRTPLLCSVENDRKDIVEILVSLGADINAKNDNGQTPLHRAVYHCNINLVELLVSLGADINAIDNNGETPLVMVNRTYSLRECPEKWRLLKILKKPGLCFITTATCLSLNKSDDCYELNTFRRFRDEWLLKNKEGQELIKEYYQIAPEIVNKINELPNKEEIYEDIWRSYLSRCLNLIETGNFEEAKALYIELVRIYLNKFFYKRSF